MKSSGTVVAGGTKVLMRHPKEESFSVNVMKGNSGVCCQHQERLFAGGINELLHETGSSWIVIRSGTEGYTS